MSPAAAAIRVTTTGSSNNRSAAADANTDKFHTTNRNFSMVQCRLSQQNDVIAAVAADQRWDHTL